MTKSRRHPFRTLFAFCFILIVAAGVIGYASGWINFKHEEQKATIEIESCKIKEAADDAIETGKEFIEESGKRLSETATEANSEEEPAEPETAGDVDAPDRSVPREEAEEPVDPASEQ